MESNERLTQSKLKNLLHYDPDTGVFTWKNPAGTKTKPGDIAGCASKHLGYRYITVLNKRRLAHRLAWVYMTGRWPEDQIDHINGERDDNRWVNLREADQSQQCGNSALRSDNKAGARGVYWCKEKRKWAVDLQYQGRRYRLGRYTDFEEATELSELARQMFYETFYTDRRVGFRP